MGMFDRLFGRQKTAAPAPPEDAVIVHFQYGSTDLSRLIVVEDALEEALAAAGVGVTLRYGSPGNGARETEAIIGT